MAFTSIFQRLEQLGSFLGRLVLDNLSSGCRIDADFSAQRFSHMPRNIVEIDGCQYHRYRNTGRGKVTLTKRFTATNSNSPTLRQLAPGPVEFQRHGATSGASKRLATGGICRCWYHIPPYDTISDVCKYTVIRKKKYDHMLLLCVTISCTAEGL